MRRVVSLCLPTWPTDRLRRTASATPPPAEPLVTSEQDGQRRVIAAVDLAARRLGLRPGLPIAQARARIPGLHVVDADASGDSEALERLAQWCLRYSPIVAVDPPDGLWIDATGVAHLFGGEASLLDGIVRRLGEAAIRARAAIADTTGAAHAMARYGSSKVIVVPVGATSDALRALPMTALRLGSELLAELRRLGFESIDDLERTPRAPLALRFGSEIGRRLDQAFGRLQEPFDPIVPADLVSVTRPFIEPIGAQASLEQAIVLLAALLCTDLASKDLGVRRLDLLFHRVDNTLQAIRVGTARPVRDSKRLARLLSDHLETVDPGFGVERMTLSASLTEPLVPRQSTTLIGNEASDDLSALVDLLANRLGPDRLYRATPIESDVPERSVRRVPGMAPPRGEAWPASLPRPTRLITPPEAIETMALLPDHPPVSFTWRGARRRITRADGPERIFGEWWKSASEVPAVRDYFQVEDEAGERFWIFRSGDGDSPSSGSQRWFLHGIFA